MPAAGKLPVVWMHTPYNRRNTQNGLTAANYPGKALQLVKYGYVVAVADFRGLYASFGQQRRLQPRRVAGRRALRRLRHHRVAGRAALEQRQDRHVGLLGHRRQPDAGADRPRRRILKAIFPMSCEWDVYPFVAPGGITPPRTHPP